MVLFSRHDHRHAGLRKKLEAGGVDRRQAEVYAKAARDFLTRRIDVAAYVERLIAAGVDPTVAEIHAKVHAQMARP